VASSGVAVGAAAFTQWPLMRTTVLTIPDILLPFLDIAWRVA
jgi:hypothetical protein